MKIEITVEELKELLKEAPVVITTDTPKISSEIINQLSHMKNQWFDQQKFQQKAFLCELH
mgnify:FL=1